MTILIVIIGISLLILVHEFGHFLVAKKMGLLVEEFGFGFPPRLFSKKVGETTYSLNLLPFGGFVKLFGEDRSDMTDPNQRIKSKSTKQSQNAEKSQVIEKELSYKLNGLLFEAKRRVGRYGRERQYGDVFEQLLKEAGLNYGREVVITLGDQNSNKADFIVEDKILIELKTVPFIDKAHYYQVKRYLEFANLELGIIVNFRDEVMKPRRVLNPRFSHVRIVSENSGNFVDLNRSFAYQKAWKRALVIVAGVLMNFLLGWLLMSLIFMIGTPKTLLIAEVLNGSPAEVAGIMPQDQILGFSAAGETPTIRFGGKSGDFIDFVNKNRGKEIALDINRGGEKLSFEVIPRVEGEGAVGVSLVEAGVDKKPFFIAIWEGLKTAGFVVAAIFGAFLNLIWGLLTQGKVLIDFVGPIGIFGVASQAGALGFLYLIQLIAMISLNLTVLNIFPFPALDGGRLLFILIEKIKGSPLSPNFERAANATGFIILLLLMIAITARDIVRLF